MTKVVFFLGQVCELMGSILNKMLRIILQISVILGFQKTDYPRYQWACSYAVRHTPPHHICSSETKAVMVKTLKTGFQKPKGDISVALSIFYKAYGPNTTCDMVTTEIPNSLHTTFFSCCTCFYDKCQNLTLKQTNLQCLSSPRNKSEHQMVITTNKWFEKQHRLLHKCYIQKINKRFL